MKFWSLSLFNHIIHIFFSLFLFLYVLVTLFIAPSFHRESRPYILPLTSVNFVFVFFFRFNIRNLCSNRLRHRGKISVHRYKSECEFVVAYNLALNRESVWVTVRKRTLLLCLSFFLFLSFFFGLFVWGKGKTTYKIWFRKLQCKSTFKTKEWQAKIRR